MHQEATKAPNDASAIDTFHISARSIPWIPFSHVNDKILLKYFKIDPITGEVVLLMKAAKGEGANIHRHTGTVMVYTLTGRWKYDQPDWVAEAPFGEHYAAYAPPLSGQYFNQRKTTIYAGSTEIQKNIIAKMILGL